MRSPEVNINPSYPSIEAVLSGMTSSGKYDHLRLILSKNNNRTMGQKYLMITPSAFGAVKLLDVDYGENRICMTLQDTCTGMIKNVHLDIADPEFSFLLISWQDIREMMVAESDNKLKHDDLLEFDYT